MSLRRIIQDIRRRSVWRVLLIYLGASWAVLQFVDQVQNRLSLPPWVYGAALIMLLIGLPVVLATAFVQESNSPEVEDTVPQRILTWRNAIGGGLLAFIVGGAALVLWLNFTPREKSSEEDDATQSVAVLPFVDMSASKDQEYFGDGITEEILNVLAQVDGLRVPARTSSFSFKGKNLPIKEIAQQLNVAHVLEGSIRKSGDQVRITAQLIDARNDKHLWSQTFDRDAGDIFAVQDEIAHAIADALRLKIEQPEGSTTFVATETGSARAHELYLRGLYYWHRRHADELPKALELFQEATRVDPNYARAWAGVALTYSLLPQFGPFDLATAIREGKAAATVALQLDPSAADAEAALGQIAQELEWDWAAATKHLDRAVQLDPNYATAHQWRMELFITLGRYKDALAEGDRALAIDPLSLVIQHVRAFAFGFSGDPKSELDIYNAILKRDPEFYLSIGVRPTAAWKLKRYDELLATHPTRFIRVVTLGMKDPNQRAAALRALADPTERGRQWIGVLVTAYLQLGEPDSAAVLLDRSADGWQASLGNFARSPNSKPMQNLPAFLSYRRKLNL